MTSTAESVPARRTGARREQILRTAAELFARKGFNGVSINDIGAAVGISGPALYRHFPSKDAVLGEMLVDVSQRLLEQGQQVVASTSEPRERMERLIEMQVDFALAEPALITVHNRDIASLGDADQREVRRLQRRYVDIWTSAISDAVPGTDESRARAAAHAAFGLINSTPHSARVGRDEMAVLLRRMASAALLSDGALGT
jgi:AcrR family transcriptional regulator